MILHNNFKARISAIYNLLSRFIKRALKTKSISNQKESMFVFEFITPGIWLDYEDQTWAFKIRNQIRSLESQFFEANTTLNLFIRNSKPHQIEMSRENWEHDSNRKSEIKLAIEEERKYTNSTNDWDAIQFETEIRFKREQWSLGRTPKEFEHNLSFIYARSFLYALDAFEKFLGVLAKEPGVPGQLADIHKRMEVAFPHLRGVRNTAHHLEDRARGLGAGQNPKPLDLKPITNNFVSAPSGGVLILNSLNGSRYGSTMSDGHYGEIDVSPESMQHLQKILEEVLQSFQWRGPKQHSPSI
jgi:hypothetical protein